MSTIDERFSEFTRAWLAGDEPDANLALDGLSGTDRLELADLIDGFLDANLALLSTGPVDPEEFAKAQASNPILQRIGRSVAGVSGVWPSMLPRLRERAQLNREEIAGQLADALGNPQGAEKISDYYHRMEWGDLPASGVNDRVIDALAQILDSDANQLRESGMSGDSGTGESSDDPEIVEARVQAFARFAASDIEQTATNDTGPHDNLASWDETDRLFLGG